MRGMDIDLAAKASAHHRGNAAGMIGVAVTDDQGFGGRNIRFRAGVRCATAYAPGQYRRGCGARLLQSTLQAPTRLRRQKCRPCFQQLR